MKQHYSNQFLSIIGISLFSLYIYIYTADEIFKSIHFRREVFENHKFYNQTFS